MAVLKIDNGKKQDRINPELYGHFSEHLGRCIYEGIYVGENSDIPNVNGMRTDVVEALKEMKIPVLRWPGGCFADEYHWKDGIGPKANRKKMINTHWGGVVEDNSFGTHEYFELCRQLGCKTYVNMNVGSGTVQEMSEWVEYITFGGVSPMAELRKANGHEEPWKLDYIGIGNENWGCGGNMRPVYYADLYRRYQTYCRSYAGAEPFKKICGGPNADDYEWTEKVLYTCLEDHAPANAHQPGYLDGLSLHYYTFPEMEEDWNQKGSATEFSEEAFYQTLHRSYKMKELITKHGEIMDRFDPEKKIGLMIDEWGVWTDVEPGTNPGFLYQQNTMRDALVAGMNLNLFNKHSDRVKMANIAQMVNVLQSVLLTEGPGMIKTPTYYVFRMFAAHQGAFLLSSSLESAGIAGCGENTCPKLMESVSMDAAGGITITLTNNSLTDSEELEILLSENAGAYRVREAICLSGAMNAFNTFDSPENVKEEPFDAYEKTAEGVRLVMPACSVLLLRLEMPLVTTQ